MAELWQYHVSELMLVAKCAYRWQLEKLEGRRPGLTRSYLAVGSGVDKSVGSNLGTKIEEDELLPVDVCQDIARDDTAERLRDGFEPDEDERKIGLERAKGKAIDKATRMAEAHRELIAPAMRPANVAAKFTIKVPRRDYEIVGEIDVREVYAQGVAIRDTKTTATKPSADTAFQSTQLTMYAMAEYSVFSDHVLPVALGLDFLIDYKAKPRSGPGHDAWVKAEAALGRKPPAVPMTQQTHRSIDDFEALLARIDILDGMRRRGDDLVAEGKERLDLFPADASNKGAWWCSKEHCPHWVYCKFVRRPVSANVPKLVQLGEEAA